MKKAAKWVVILWSVFCLFGVIYGMANVGKELGNTKNEYEDAGAAIGLGCGMGMWVGIWLAIAGPGMFIYLIAGKVANGVRSCNHTFDLIEAKGKGSGFNN